MAGQWMDMVDKLDIDGIAPRAGTEVKHASPRRLWETLRMLVGLRRHDFRAAGTWIATMYPGKALLARLWLFTLWALDTVWRKIPDALVWARFVTRVSRTPIWLAQGDPFENYPWTGAPDAKLPAEADVIVIGAGFVGSAVAYHWAKHGRASLVVLERDGVASGSAGRNEGLVVMGRYYYLVYSTVLSYLNRARLDLPEPDRNHLAHEFAAAYARAGYVNAEMIQQTIQEEEIDCEYVRKGWVQATDADHIQQLETSVRMAQETGYTDWTRISGNEAFERSGMRAPFGAGFSIGAAMWHPAKWCWGLFRVALRSKQVELFTRTRVLKVEDLGERYAVHTERGCVRARYVVNAAEACTPALFPQFHDIILPMQTQAAFGASDGGSMNPAWGSAGIGVL